MFTLAMPEEALRQDNTRMHHGKLGAFEFITTHCPKVIAYEGDPFDIVFGARFLK